MSYAMMWLLMGFLFGFTLGVIVGFLSIYFWIQKNVYKLKRWVNNNIEIEP